MALGINEKVKIAGVLKNNDDFYYEDFIIKPRKYTDDELIDFILKTIIKHLDSEKEVKSNILKRHFYALYVIFEYCMVTGNEYSDDLAKRTIQLKQDYIKYLTRLKLEVNNEVEEKLLELVNLVTNNRANIDEEFLKCGGK